MASPVNSGDFVANAIARGSQGYPMSMDDVVWLRVAPPRLVQQRTGSYYVWSRAESQRIQHDGARASDGVAKQSKMSFATATYSCEHISDRMFVSGDEVKDSASVYSPREVYGAQVMSNVLRIGERRFDTDFFTTSVWGTDNTLSGSDQWNATGGGDPREAIRAGCEAIRQNLGTKPQRLVGVTTAEVASILAIHPAFEDLSGFMARGAEVKSMDVIAAALGLDEILVSHGAQNTAVEGATASQADLLDADNFLILAVNPNPFDFSQPTALATMVSSPLNVRFYSDDAHLPGSFFAEADIDFDTVLVANELGYLIADCLA